MEEKNNNQSDTGDLIVGFVKLVVGIMLLYVALKSLL